MFKVGDLVKVQRGASADRFIYGVVEAGENETETIYTSYYRVEPV